MITDWRTWVFALIVGPTFWLLLIAFLKWVLFELKAIKKWYFGLPIYQYPAMLLIILGARHIKKPYGMWRKMDGRWWLSVNTTGFQVEESIDD